MPSINTELIRDDIAACRQAGCEHRFEDVVQAADNAIAIIGSSQRESSVVDQSIVRLHAAANGYKGMALLHLKRFDSSMLTLEESYRLFQEYLLSMKKNGGETNVASSLPLLDKVIKCLVQVCHILNRSPPSPPLVKFPRTPHLFRPQHSKAVTDDDLVLSKDDSMFKLLSTAGGNSDSDSDNTAMHISLEEKVDGANLGISLSLDGKEILVQNRSHYISHGEHAQFSQLASWIELHEDEIKRILLGDNVTQETAQRRILYGEWVVAKHSIRYERLPAYFIAFDISEGDRFVSRRRFHTLMRGSGIPVTPTLTDCPNMNGMDQNEVESLLMDLLRTPSQFRADGGPLEGIVFRVDVGDWMEHRCKLVDPEFTSGITGHWAKAKIEKQRVDVDFALNYLESCYHHTEENDSGELQSEVFNPRQRAVVTYRRVDDNGDDVYTATCSVLAKEPARPQQGMVVLPRNLCWLWAGEVIVSSTPKSTEQIQAMHDALNVGLVLTLTKEEPLPTEWFVEEHCNNYFCPISDGMAPTMQEMDDIGDAIVRTVVGGKVVLEHCGGGKGRAGTVAACLFLRFGWDGIQARIEEENDSNCNRGSGRFLRHREPFMSGEEAIAEIRRRRPGSLETPMQESFVREYAQHLWRIAADTEDYFFEFESLEHESQNNGSKAPIKRKVPKYIILAGLPGSGKSTLGSKLKNEDGKQRNDWVHASTDELGKKGCCSVVGRAASRVDQGGAGGVVVDACNITESKRREWLDVMFKPRRELTALIFFDIAVETCVARVRCRVDHPTIPFGRGGSVVESFAKNLQLPTEKERDLFGQIVVLRSNDDVLNLLASWGVSGDW